MKRLVLLLVILAFGFVGIVQAQRPTGQVISGATSGGTAVAIQTDANGVVSVQGISGGTPEIVQTTPNATYPTAFGIAIAALGATSGTVATASTVLIGNLFFTNITSGAVTVDVTNTAGTAILKSFSIPANSNLPLNFESGLLAVGIKWWASATSSINASVTGWQ